MAKSGATELLMPVVIPAELWKESGRWDYYGPELLRFTDRKQNDFCLGPTHEEVVVDVVRRTVRSYRKPAGVSVSDTNQVPRRSSSALRPYART